jgi:hypothetical protein
MAVGTNAPWFDASVQHPLFDDNADGEGSNDLSDPDGDGKCLPPEQGLCSQELFIGVSSITGNDPGDVAVTHVTQDLFLGIDESSTSALWAQVDNNSRLSAIWVEVKPPNYSLEDPGATGQLELDLPKIPTTDYNSDQDRYEWYGLDGFDDPGTYQVFYFAKDDITGSVSPLMESRVYKALTGNNPPDPFTLVSPDTGALQTNSVFILSWNDAIDIDGDILTYTLLISKDDDTFSDPIRKEGIKYNSCLVGPEDGITDLSTFYWKVLAIDEYGAIKESDSRYFTTNITNPIAGWIKGLVYNSQTDTPINDAAVTIGSLNLNASLHGFFLGTIPPGSYTLYAAKTGYKPKSLSVTIPGGSVVSKNIALDPLDPVDTDNDGILDAIEIASDCLNPNDDDSDDDGLLDGNEDADHDGVVDTGETDPCEEDSDNDGLQDGTEIGLTAPQGSDTDLNIFILDSDPSTTTNPLDDDTDDDGLSDGKEDANQNGRVDLEETDPNENTPVPIIMAIEPERGIAGAQITIFGNCFGSSQENSNVTFFDSVISSEILSWSDNEIICKVPNGAKTGCMTVTTDVGESNCVSFIVSSAMPWIPLLLLDNGGFCRNNGDCSPGDFCEKPIGVCSGRGSCKRQPDVCNAIMDPVCGCDGFTYTNAACAAVAGVSVAYLGECD